MLTENKTNCYPRLNHDRLTSGKTEVVHKINCKN